MASPAHCPLEGQWREGTPRSAKSENRSSLALRRPYPRPYPSAQRTLRFSDMPPLRSPWTLPTHTLTQHKQATTRQALDRLGKIHAPLAATLLQQPLHPQRPASPQGGYWVPGGKGRGPRTTTRPRSNKPTGGHDVRFSRRRGPEP
eukprot:2610244-Pyramimonas_sp.AAC.1